MSIVNIFLDHYAKGRDKEGHVQYEVGWLVQSDDSFTTPEDVEGFFGVENGDLFSGDLEARASDFKAERDQKDQKFWHYTITFSTRQNDSDNPLDAPYEIEFSGEEIEEEVFYDADTDELITNSAGFPFVNQVKRKANVEVIRVSKYRAFDDPAIALWVADKLNESDFNGRSAGTVLTSFPERKNEWRQIGSARRQIWRDTMVFKYRADGWKETRLDEGYQYYTNENKLVEVAISKDLKVKKSTVLLDGEGKKLDQDADPVSVEFNRYQKIDFSIFGLDGVF